MAKVTKKLWTSRGPTGKRVKHVSYGYDLRVNGTREKKFSAAWATETEAHAALTARLQEIEAGSLTRPAARTFAQVIEEYLAYKRGEGKRTVDGDARLLKNRVQRVIAGELPIRQLTEAVLERYKKQRIGEVSPYTVANELAVLRHLLGLAKKWRYITTLPAIALPKKPEGRLRYLEVDELARLLDACRASRNPYLFTIVLLAVHTGMRKGEILGLEWARVDLSSARITLYRTKSGKPRGVPINRDVYEALIALEREPRWRAGLLFRKRDDRAWGQIRRAFESALAHAGIKDFRFHDLRHTAASHLIMRGATLFDVKELLGHADIQMTMRYAHLSPVHLRGAVERLEGLTGSPRPEPAKEAVHAMA